MNWFVPGRLCDTHDEQYMWHTHLSCNQRKSESLTHLYETPTAKSKTLSQYDAINAMVICYHARSCYVMGNAHMWQGLQIWMLHIHVHTQHNLIHKNEDTFKRLWWCLDNCLVIEGWVFTCIYISDHLSVHGCCMHTIYVHIIESYFGNPLQQEPMWDWYSIDINHWLSFPVKLNPQTPYSCLNHRVKEKAQASVREYQSLQGMIQEQKQIPMNLHQL